MEQLNRLLLIISVVLMISCTAEDVPAGLYGYQVTRLMTHDSSKVWQINALEQDICDQAYFYRFDLVEDPVRDSVEFREIRWNCTANGFTDTVYITRGLPSTTGIDFSDSLLWANETSWLITSITESYLTVQDINSSSKLELTTVK